MANPIPEVTITDGQVPETILRGTTPVVLRGLVKDWTIVDIAQKGTKAGLDYLRQHDKGVLVAASKADPEAGGRVFYDANMARPNLKVHRVPLGQVFDRLEELEGSKKPPLVYVGSTTMDVALPNFEAENPTPLNRSDALKSIWIGNKSRIAAHYDLPDNVACVALGRRRFTLFPPEQLGNLYVGPLDNTPAGQSISMVDLHNPDYERFPKFKDAEKAALSADMEPGDGIYIPSMWWHHVEAKDEINMLVNYWWRRTGDLMGPPLNALIHAMMEIRDLPEHEKAIWKQHFDHYVFEYDQEDVEHIPVSARGVLGPIDKTQASRMREFLINRLSR